MITSAIIALYFWTHFGKTATLGNTLLVNTPVVMLAGIAATICFISYFWIPKKLILPVSITIYLLTISSIATLVVSTGGASSPFIALWMFGVVFAGIFGVWGSLPIIAAAGVFIANQYMTARLTNTVLIITIFSSLLPLIASYIIWHSKSDREEAESDNKAYKNLANELSEVSSQSEVVINAIGDGVIAIDNQGIIRLINPAAQSVLGWGKQDALALSYKSVLKLVNQKDEELDPTSDPIQQAINTNSEIRTSNLTLITKNGKKMMISLVVSPVGELGSGVITVFRDVTKEKAEEREQAEFISTASHEMRTPVASIEGYLGLALNPQTAQIDAKARDFIMKAHSSAEHLGRLFQDLLDVAKSEDGRISNKPSVVNVVTFVHDIVQGLKAKALEKGLTLNYKPMPDRSNEIHIAPAYSVNLDKDHIREIVDNLVDNAIKYTQHGEIVVDVTGDDDHVTISVKDSGIGIPNEDMPHLFQKFYRVDNKDTREIGGTGLGLFLCRKLAEIMGGRIWAESKYGSGSTFYVELPRISNSEATKLAEQESIAAQQEAAKEVATTAKPPVTSAPTPVAEQQPKKVIEPVNVVPRGQALTPDQIAAYVQKQRALAAAHAQTPQQPASPQSPTGAPRPRTINIPPRRQIVQ